MSDNNRSPLGGEIVEETLDRKAVEAMRRRIGKGEDVRGELMRLAALCLHNVYTSLYVPDAGGVAAAREWALKGLGKLQELEGS